MKSQRQQGPVTDDLRPEQCTESLLLPQAKEQSWHDQWCLHHQSLSSPPLEPLYQNRVLFKRGACHQLKDAIAVDIVDVGHSLNEVPIACSHIPICVLLLLD
jgi:hypothetical protein